MDSPLTLAAAWGAWLTVGLALAIWSRRLREARMRFEAQQSAARNILAKPKPGVRLPRAVTAAPDAFGELQALLDPPPSSSARRPGDEHAALKRQEDGAPVGPRPLNSEL